MLTRLFDPHARLIRRPFYIRGKSNVSWGRKVTIGRGARIEAFGRRGEINIRLGDGVQINDYVHIGSVLSVTIGHRVLIASRVFIADHNHGIYNDRCIEVFDRTHAKVDKRTVSAPSEAPADRLLSVAPVVIEDDVWLGEGVCVLAGVTIGAGSVVGANSVVTKDVPPASIAVGSPARVVKRYDGSRGWVDVSEARSGARLKVVRSQQIPGAATPISRDPKRA